MEQSTSQRKRSTDQPSMPVRKLRALSGFNLWHSQFMKSDESDKFESWADKNHQSGIKWREMSKEEQARYNAEAAAINKGEIMVDQNKEAQKLIHRMFDIGERASQVSGLEILYVVVHKDTHFVGGSSRGRQFLIDQGFHIPYSFMGYVSAPPPSANKETARSQPSSSGCSDERKKQLRQEVRKIFNDLYAQHVRNPEARMPYKWIKDYGIRMEGLPAGIELKSLGSYGIPTMEAIIQNKNNLKLYVEKKLVIENPDDLDEDSDRAE